MDYEWDPRKAAQNSKKHGVHFTDAITALEDEQALTFQDPASLAEERWITLGRDAMACLLVVIYTWRGGHHPHYLGETRNRTGAQPIWGTA